VDFSPHGVFAHYDTSTSRCRAFLSFLKLNCAAALTSTHTHRAAQTANSTPRRHPDLTAAASTALLLAATQYMHVDPSAPAHSISVVQLAPTKQQAQHCATERMLAHQPIYGPARLAICIVGNPQQPRTPISDSTKQQNEGSSHVHTSSGPPNPLLQQMFLAPTTCIAQTAPVPYSVPLLHCISIQKWHH
jgi:hypothetical protein